MAAIVSILLLPLGPLLIPRLYLIFLLIYFTCFLYTQINHVFKFWITASNIKKTIRRWNQLHDSFPASSDNEKNGGGNSASSAPASPTPTPTRERYPTPMNDDDNDDERMNDMETSLKLYDDNHFVHAFIVPNYAEPEALLRDTIKRLANHRYVPPFELKANG